MKKCAVLVLFCLIGCQANKSTTSGPIAFRMAKAKGAAVDPSTILLDRTLTQCQNFQNPAPVSAATYESVVNGKPGTYKLTSAVFYAEPHSSDQKNASAVLTVTNVQSAGTALTGTQEISCTDTHELDNMSASNIEQIPLSIDSQTGAIASDASLSDYVVKGKRNPNNEPATSKFEFAKASYSDLKSFIAGSNAKLNRQVDLSLDQNNQLQVLVTDKIVGEAGRTAIHKVMATYTFVPGASIETETPAVPNGI